MTRRRTILIACFLLALFCWAPRARSQSAEELLNRAQALEKIDQQSEAIAAYRDYLRARPEDDEARARLARLLSWQNQFAESAALFREILSRHPADVDVRIGLARVLSWQKEFAEARALYERILSEQPHNLEARRGLADVFYWSGNYTQALRLYEGIYAETKDPELLKSIANVRAEINQRLRAPVGAVGEKLTLPYRDYLKFGYGHGTFSNQTPNERAWLWEFAKPLGEQTIVARAEVLNRFDKHDGPISAEFYSPLWNQAWGYLGIGIAASPQFSSKFNLSGEIFQGLGVLHPALSFLEPSFGFRWLSFAQSKAEILVPGLTIYFPGALWLSEKVYYSPDTNAATLQSEITWQPAERLRLFVSGSFGKSGERIGVVSDLAKIHSWMVRGGVMFPLTDRFSAETAAFYEERSKLYIRRGGSFNLIYHW